MTRSTAVAVASAASAVVVAVPLAVPAVAPAKGDARAAIQAPTRCDAAPGDRITIRFRLTTAVHGSKTGAREPFGAAGVFVRLRRAPGLASVRRDARAMGSTGAAKGVYTARVTVPRGGIRRIDVGIDGVRYNADGTTEPAPAYLPVVGDPCRLAG